MKLLDSDTFTLACHGKPGLVERVLQSRDSGELMLPSIVRLEALRGRIEAVLKAGSGSDVIRLGERLTNTEAIVGTFEIVPFTTESGRRFDALVTDKRIRSMGLRDLMIACICLAHDATLVTRNLKDFKLVAGLKLENWAD
jgi:tRNA(fMet)-specific endonuclease VapC